MNQTPSTARKIKNQCGNRLSLFRRVGVGIPWSGELTSSSTKAYAGSSAWVSDAFCCKCESPAEPRAQELRSRPMTELGTLALVRGVSRPSHRPAARAEVAG